MFDFPTSAAFERKVFSGVLFCRYWNYFESYYWNATNSFRRGFKVMYDESMHLSPALVRHQPLIAQTWQWTRDDLVLNPSGLDLRHAFSWAWGDLDRDGYNDVIVRHNKDQSDGKLVAYRGRVSTTPPFWIEAPELLRGLEEPSFSEGISLTDLDGDGSLNIITRVWRDPYWWLINWKKDSSGNWQPDTTTFRTLIFDYRLRDRDDPFFADADFDGDLDLLIGSQAPFRKAGVRFFENVGNSRQPIWREDSMRLELIYQSPVGYESFSPILMQTDADTLPDLIIAFYIEDIAGVAVYPGVLDSTGLRWSGNYLHTFYSGLFSDSGHHLLNQVMAKPY